MIPEVNSLASVMYWIGRERVPQRFYVAFCLLVASAQDAFLGSWERERSNSNWSVTCSYYSLVHGARLLTFLALGDFPQSHNALRTLLPRQPRGGVLRSLNQHSFPFDWLNWFSGRTSSVASGHSREQQNITVDLRGIIVDYLTAIGLRDADERVHHIGELLIAAGRLRNETNYEALLIAHEHHHAEMSQTFTHLSELMCNAALVGLNTIGDAFSAFVRTDPHIRGEQENYMAFLYDYLEKRLVRVVGKKLNGGTGLAKKLKVFAKSIQPKRPKCDYRNLESAVSMTVFSEKTQLMREFRRHVRELESAVHP